MTVAPPEGVTPVGMLPGTGTPSTGASTDKDMFLQLLVAQMRYQDPTNPTDSAEFLAQSAQFTALEKMQDVADQTGVLVAAQMAFGANSLVGRTVGYTLPDGTDGTGIVRGVTFGADGPVLDVDGVDVHLFSVVGVTATESEPGEADQSTDPA